MPLPTLVFDLDGTLIDTAPDLILATNHTLETAGFAPVAHDMIRPYISFGTRRMLQEGLAHQGASVSEAKLDDMFERLIAFYTRNMTASSVPFDGICDVLETLGRRGQTVAICTNKLEGMAKQLMGELALEHHFKVITGRDTFPVSKPDPGHLLGTIRLAGGDPANSIMVGDSTTDHATARAAGVPIIGVTFGYTDVPMAELDCDAVISHYDAFFGALEQVLSTRTGR